MLLLMCAAAMVLMVTMGMRQSLGLYIAPIIETIGPSASIHVVAGADHSLKLSRKDPAAQAATYDAVQRTMVEWVRMRTK